MKRTLYSLLLIFLLSCGSSSQKQSVVAIHLKNGVVHDGILLFVRDTSVLLQERLVSRDSLLLMAVNIPTSNIHSVEIIQPSSWEASLFGGLFGGLVGCFVGYETDKAIGNGGGHPNIDGFGGALLGCGAGVALGIAGGVAIDNIPTTVSPENQLKWERLRSYAKYPDEEPDELKKIK